MSLDYGIIGNCKTSALISKTGSIDWCCFPCFDNPSIFAKILDKKKGGSFDIKPVGKYKISQKYEKHTNILVTSFENKKCKFEIIDFFTFYKVNHKKFQEDKLYRYVKVLKGKPKVKVFFNPKMDYARGKTKISIGECSITARNKKNFLNLHSNISFEKIVKNKPVVLEKESFFILSFNSKCESESLENLKKNLEKTRDYWHDFVRRGHWPKMYKEKVIRSALILKLLTYSKTGAVIAAATTSIPEELGSSKNWDYRYCWIRDSSFTIDAFTRICHFGEAIRYINFLKLVSKTCDFKKKCDFNLQVMYSVKGNKKLTEKKLLHLAGYKNSKPVRVGNAAYKQKQNDVIGEVINIIYDFYVYYKYFKNIDDELWSLVYHLVNHVINEWKHKDRSLWEFRKLKKHFTSSKLLSWVAMDRAIKIARYFNKKVNFSLWEKTRDEIKKSILEQGFNEKVKAFTMYYGSEDLDASVLLMLQYGFLSPTDKRIVKTVKVLERELSFKNGLMLRYKFKKTPKKENAFLICSYWLINALYLIGEKKKAVKYFNELLNFCNHLGLYSEIVSIKTGELLGNIPQSYTHLAIINTATLLNNKGIRPTICNYHLELSRKTHYGEFKNWNKN